MRTKVLHYFHTFHPDAQAELNRLAGEEARLTLEKARQGEGEPVKPRRMSEPPVDLDAQLEDVRAAMDEQRKVIASGVVRIHVKGLSRAEFRRIQIAHPPREGDPLDAQLGYNCDTFGDALIQACIVRTENLDGRKVPNKWDKWADEMTDGQWNEVFNACMHLTRDPNPSFPQ